MSEFAIFIEGGGNSRREQGPLRLGFQKLLGEILTTARDRKCRSRVILCGGRSETIELFLNEKRNRPEIKCFMLVDSEEIPERPTEPWRHLAQRDDIRIKSAHDGDIGLMVVVMETWICADIASLANYFGTGFRAEALPSPQSVLESVPKRDICEKLSKSTKESRKGDYHKQRHGPDLIGKLDPVLLRQRCPSFARFIDLIQAFILESQ